ncbi:MAG TPA: DUF6308 family protein [Corynebacterium sp.]|nr:DUF6308 family protein [Corynebacterium sp.]
MDSVSGMKLPRSLRGEGAQAVDYLRRYYSARLDSVPEDRRVLFDGAYFDHWVPEDPRPNVFTAEDIVAVQCLGTPIRNWSAAVRVLNQHSDILSRLLIEVGHDRDLASVPAGELTSAWPARRLERELQTIPGIGPVVASKLIARKRPNLYPIQDRQIRRLTGLSRSDFLGPFHREWTENAVLRRQLEQARERAGLTHRIGLLRTFDVVAWMEQRDVDKQGKPAVPFSPVLE